MQEDDVIKGRFVRNAAPHLAAIVLLLCCSPAERTAPEVDGRQARTARIEPDLDGTVIPPNIAPLNFTLSEAGDDFYLGIEGENGTAISVRSAEPWIEIPVKSWKRLLAANRGASIRFDIRIRSEKGSWKAFRPIELRIAPEEIDAYLSYRLIYPLYILWRDMGIYQRCLESFEVRPILHNQPLQKACMNCHAFCNQNSEKMLIHLRKGPGTHMLLAHQDRIQRIDTTTDFNRMAGAYPSWHPLGSLIAFSVNKVNQFFHGIGENRDVFDWSSDLILYDVESRTVTTIPELSSPDWMETYPSWAADGRALYFCRAPQIDQDRLIDEQYRDIRYELARIPYDPANRSWGEVETLLTPASTGKSMVQPRPSPDNRFLLFCMADYGNFPVYRPESDLYLYDLRERSHRKLEINSEFSESWHSWSSNSRWIVFSSKREDGLCARPYFSYVDDSGRAHKPFRLPQRDPRFYDSSLKTYNVPEFTANPVTVRPQELARTALALDRTQRAQLDPAVAPRVDSGKPDSPWMPSP